MFARVALYGLASLQNLRKSTGCHFMNTPQRIIIIDGRLKMADGSSLKAYLKEWQDKTDLKDGAFVNINRHEYQTALEADAELGRNWAS